MSSVIELQDFFLTKLELNWIVKDPSVTLVKNVDFDYDLALNIESPDLYKLEFNIIYQPNYHEGMPDGPVMNAGLVGFFTCPDSMEEKKRSFSVKYNGCLILYGILRGQVSSITGAFPKGKLMLPSFNMLEKLKELDQKQNLSDSSLEEGLSVKKISSRRDKADKS